MKRNQGPASRAAAASPNQTVEITGIDPSADGAGFATLGKRRVLVDDVIPGERVEARLLDSHRDALRAEVVKVVSPSPFRVTPMCRHAGVCGGCAWQHIAYGHQLQLKRDLVETLIRSSLGPRAPRVEPVLPASPSDEAPRGFRGKVHFVFGVDSRTGDLVMGHYRRRSQEVIPIEECPVHNSRGNEIAFAVRDALRRQHVAAASPADRTGIARHVVVRVAEGSGESLATLVVTRNDKSLRPAVRRLLDGPAAPEGLHLNVNDGRGPFLFGKATVRIHGLQRVREQMAGASFLASPTAFFQTNVAAAHALVRLVLSFATGYRHALDLYAGAGLFAIPLALSGTSVIAVEENPNAVDDGEVSRKLNAVAASACRFLCSSVDDLAERRIRSIAAFPADLVVVDPPRAGCGPRALRWIAETVRPARVIYVSCNPQALAIDLGRLMESGFACTRLQPIDMFPHTAHVETVAVLDRLELKRRGQPEQNSLL